MWKHNFLLHSTLAIMEMKDPFCNSSARKFHFSIQIRFQCDIYKMNSLNYLKTFPSISKSTADLLIFMPCKWRHFRFQYLIMKWNLNTTIWETIIRNSGKLLRKKCEPLRVYSLDENNFFHIFRIYSQGDLVNSHIIYYTTVNSWIESRTLFRIPHFGPGLYSNQDSIQVRTLLNFDSDF